MKKSSKIYNLYQARNYINSKAYVVDIGMDWDFERGKPLFWVKFDIEQEEYLIAKKAWMENKNK